MATNIKGITIEIDGNTTGLSNALSNVNKNISSVSSELKQVNSLLKLDPGNTELIAQKQKLLSDAISDTSSKLATLKDAKAQADQQFASGQISEEQYRALEREIVKTEQSLGSFNNQLKETQDTGGKIDFTGITAGMKNVGEVAGKIAVEVGKVVAALTVGLATAVAGAGATMVSMAKSSGKMADDLMTLSAQTNVSTDTLQKWDYAAKFIDTDVSTMTGAMAKMTKGLDSNADSFKKLGVATTDSSGKLRSQEDIFMDSIDALGKISNETERDAMSMQLFGKSAQELNPLIKAGSEQLRSLGEEAQNAGLIVGGDVLSKFGSFDDTMERMGAKLTGVKNNITQLFMPAISGMAAPIEEAIGGISGILSDGLQEGDVEKMATIVTNLTTNLATQLTTMIPKLIEFIVPAINTLISTLVTILPTLLPMLLNGVMMLITGLLNTIKTNIAPLIDLAITLVTNIATFIMENLPLIIEVAVQIILALVNGLVTAIPELIPVIIDTLLMMVNTILDNLDVIIMAGIDLILALALGLIDAIPKLLEKLPQIIIKIVEALTKPEMIEKLLSAALTLIVALAKGLVLAIPQLVLAIPQLVTALVTALENGLTVFKDIGTNIVSGIWEGISGSLTWIKDKITGWVGNVTKFIKKLFGINSPSKLMKEQVGLNIGLGVADGIESSIGAVENAMGSLTSSVETSVNPIINPTANNNPLILQIENFNNTRQTDVASLMEEAEFYRKNTSLAKGGN